MTSPTHVLLYRITTLYKCSYNNKKLHKVYKFSEDELQRPPVLALKQVKGTRGGKSRRMEVVAEILNCCGTC